MKCSECIVYKPNERLYSGFCAGINPSTIDHECVAGESMRKEDSLLNFSKES
jgi:hypothetical protein